IGHAPRSLLSRLLLASLCHPLSARHHECWSNGGYHSHYTRRENAALASARALRYGWRACALWCAGDYVTSTPSYLPARWRYAGRNADDDAREVADPIFDAESSNVRFWPKAAIPKSTAHCPFRG